MSGGVPEIAARTLLISGVATLAALLAGVPLGYALARGRFRGRILLLALVHTGMGMAPVVVGAALWLLLVRGGPLGALGLFHTPVAMGIAQLLLATPIVVGFTAASVQALPAQLGELLVMLGARPLRRLLLLAREARLGLLAAVMAGFGAAVSEVGAALTAGGDVPGSTRVLSTAILAEVRGGDVHAALGLGLVLVLLSFVVNLALTAVQQRRRAP